MNTQELDDIAAAVHRAATGAGFAAAHVSAAQVTGQAAQLEKAFEMATQAKEAADNALRLLLAMGAKRPSATPVARDTLRLDQLETPAAHAFLAALEQAAEAGAELDRERGWVDEDGQPIGHAETLAGMALQLRTEIFGPSGSGRE